MKRKIVNGLALLFDGREWTCEQKNLLLDGNRIAQITSSEIPGDAPMLDAAGKLIMPGLINAHTHAYMTIHRNFADDLGFFAWLDKVQRVEDHLTEEDIYWTTLLGILEMLRSGTTCFVDMTIKSALEKTGPRSAAAGAALSSGIRAVISRGLAGTADSDESVMKYGQAVREMELFAGESRLRFLHGPHAPYSCMPDYLRKLTRFCRERGIGQTIHLSESRAEMDAMEKEHHATPIQYVNALGVLDVPVIAAHCVYATDEDIRILRQKNVSVAINPKSNMKLGNGFAPVEKFLEAGINVCLGTDGCGSNNTLNMFREMNAAALAYKGAAGKAQCVSAGQALQMATVCGARALGREGELGVLREGALADLILIDLNQPHLIPASNIVSGLVYSANGSEVDTVIVDGRVLMENRRFTALDEQRVYAECRRITQRLGMEQMKTVG